MDGTLAGILTPEGYMRVTGTNSANWRYNYNLNDHLGGCRVQLLSDPLSNATSKAYTITSTTEYYPMGMEIRRSDVNSSGTNPYLYAGNEVERMHGLNLYEFPYRSYDYAVPGFTTPDPLAEKHYSESTYSYCGGDPVNRVDPTGLTWWKNNKNDILCQDRDPSVTGNKYVGYDELTTQSYYDANYDKIDYYGPNCFHSYYTLIKLKEVVVTAAHRNTTGIFFSFVNLSSFEKTGSNPSYSKNQFPSNQNFSLGNKNQNIRTSGSNGINQNSEQRNSAVDIPPLETPIVGLRTKYDNGTISASKLNAWQTGLELLRSSSYEGVPIGEMIYGTANSIFNLLTNVRTQGSINLDGSYSFDNERRDNIMNAWMLIGTLPMGGVAAEAKAATQATTMETFAEEGSFSISNWTGYPAEGIRPTGPFRVLIGEEYESARNSANLANNALHRANQSLSGMQIHEIQPVKFNGSPTELTNKMFLTPQEHRAYNVFWMKILNSTK